MKQGNNDNNVVHGTRKLTLADIHHQILHQHPPSLNKAVRRNFLLVLRSPLERGDPVELIMSPGSVCSIYNLGDKVNTHSWRQLGQGYLLCLSPGEVPGGIPEPGKSKEEQRALLSNLGSDQGCWAQGPRGTLRAGHCSQGPALGLLWLSHCAGHCPTAETTFPSLWSSTRTNLCSCTWENIMQSGLPPLSQQLVPQRKLVLTFEVEVLNTRTVRWLKVYSK